MEYICTILLYIYVYVKPNKYKIKIILHTEMAGPDGSFVSTGACNLEVPGRFSDICHRGCAYAVL